MITAADINGSGVILWPVVGIFAILSIVLLTGHGAGLIAGYNTSSREEKDRYDEKKLCRVIGSGMLFITALLAVMAAWENALPEYFHWVFTGLIVAASIVMIVLANTICRKK